MTKAIRAKRRRSSNVTPLLPPETRDPFHEQGHSGGIRLQRADRRHLACSPQSDARNEHAPARVTRQNDARSRKSEIAVLRRLIEGVHGAIRHEPVEIHH